MIEKKILDYLNDNMEVPAYMEYPENAELPFIVIEMTSGYSADHLMITTFVMDTYDTSMYKTALLNDSLISTMRKWVEKDHTIARVDIKNNYHDSNTATKEYRYKLVVDITYII